MYEELRKSGAVLDDQNNVVLSYNNMLVRDLRLQQITGGFVTPDVVINPESGLESEDQELVEELLHSCISKPEPLPGANPKLQDLLAYLYQIRPEEKAIIWARFTPEVNLITEVLKKEYGDAAVVTFSGQTSIDQRTDARRRFQNDPDTRFFVGQISTGGIGITLTASSYELYFSNSWALRHRIQSEDRAHRTGQTKSVTYVDFLINMPWIDSKILKSLNSGKSYTETIMAEVREATRGTQSVRS
jgi:SNF2 family DNA or RNA helicase